MKLFMVGEKKKEEVLVIKATICSRAVVSHLCKVTREFFPQKRAAVLKSHQSRARPVKNTCSLAILQIIFAHRPKGISNMINWKTCCFWTEIANDKCLSRHLNFWRRIVYDCFIRNNGFFFSDLQTWQDVLKKRF